MAQEGTEDLFKIIGIDFGTSTVSACVFEDNQCKVITDDETGRLIPSVIRFDSRVLFGENAKTNTNSPLYISDIKSIIGLKQIPEEVINSIKGCHVTQDDKGKSMIQFDNRLEEFDRNPSIYPEFLLALIMRYIAIKGSLSARIQIEKTVISVPPSFSLRQIHAMKVAASLAGLKVLRVVTDPQAIMTMMLSQTPDAECKSVVYDLGGGEFHLSYLQKDKDHLTLIDSEKLSDLSGAVIDQTFAEYLRNITGYPEDLMAEAERLKIELSMTERATLSMNGQEITRDQFVDACEAIFDRIVDALEAFIDKNKIQFEEEDKLLIVGGNSQIMNLVEKFYEKCPYPNVITLQSPDQLVASGCQVMAMDTIQEYSSFNNVLPCTLYYSANQKGAYRLFDKYTPLSECKKMISDIPKLLSSTNRLYIFDNTDSYIGYFDIPTNIEDKDYLCCFSMSDDFEIKLDIVNGERRKICSCSLQYYDEVEESDIQIFSMVNEFTSQLRRIISCFSRPEFASDPNVSQLLQIMSQYYDQESSFRLYPDNDMKENLNTLMKEFSELYYDYYINEL